MAAATLGSRNTQASAHCARLNPTCSASGAHAVLAAAVGVPDRAGPRRGPGPDQLAGQYGIQYRTLQPIVPESRAHGGTCRTEVGRYSGARLVFSGQRALAQRRPDDLRNPMRAAERDHFRLRFAVEHRVLRLAGNEILNVRHCGGLRDLVRRPLAEPDVAGLAGMHDLGRRRHGFRQRRFEVVTMTLITIDIFNFQPRQKASICLRICTRDRPLSALHIGQ
jgi:hypothetical protein